MSMWWIRFEGLPADKASSDTEPIILDVDFISEAHRWANRQVKELGAKTYHIQSFTPLKLDRDLEDLMDGWMDVGGEG